MFNCLRNRKLWKICKYPKASIWFLFIKRKFKVHIISHLRKTWIDFDECRTEGILKQANRNTITNSDTLWPMDSNYLKCVRVQMVLSTELKFCVYIKVFRHISCMDFVKSRICTFFFTRIQKEWFFSVLSTPLIAKSA